MNSILDTASNRSAALIDTGRYTGPFGREQTRGPENLYTWQMGYRRRADLASWKVVDLNGLGVASKHTTL